LKPVPPLLHGPLTLPIDLARAAPIERIRDEFSPMRRNENGGRRGRSEGKPMTKLFADYRPERHYMRGPGPKWLEKHGPVGRAGEIAHHRDASGLAKALARLVSRRPARWKFRSRVD
jgi:hypothetical protein